MLDDVRNSTAVASASAAVQEPTETPALDPTRRGEATREFEAFLHSRIVG